MARWAKRLSWTEVAEIFQTNWGVVHRAVKWVVDYGLTNRALEGIESIGVDEIAVWKGHKYLTVVYQIDNGTRRLLWVARERTEESLRGFFDLLGTSRTGALRFVASDMWKPYLKVIAERAGQALNVLDRFHIAKKLGEAVDKVRATEAKAMAAKGFDPVLKVSVRRRPSCTDVAIVPRSEVGLRQADVRAPKVVAQPLGVRCSICRWG